MANIHHATVKSAKAKGVTLSSEGDAVTAAIQQKAGERAFTLTVGFEGDEPTQTELTERAKDAWAALTDAIEWEAEHPDFQIETDEGEFVGVRISDGETIARDPDLSDLFETLQAEQGGEGEGEGEGEADEDEEEVSRSVVPPRYKREYAERGHPAHCGDWLAVTLNGFCLDAKGQNFNLATFEAICEANGVEVANLRTGTRGWQGRMRMTGRNKLAKQIVLAEGVLHIPAEASKGDGDLELQAPAAWIAEHTPKAKGKAAVAA